MAIGLSGFWMPVAVRARKNADFAQRHGLTIAVAGGCRAKGASFNGRFRDVPADLLEATDKRQELCELSSKDFVPQMD